MSNIDGITLNEDVNSSEISISRDKWEYYKDLLAKAFTILDCISDWVYFATIWNTTIYTDNKMDNLIKVWLAICSTVGLLCAYKEFFDESIYERVYARMWSILLEDIPQLYMIIAIEIQLNRLNVYAILSFILGTIGYHIKLHSYLSLCGGSLLDIFNIVENIKEFVLDFIYYMPYTVISLIINCFFGDDCIDIPLSDTKKTIIAMYYIFNIISILWIFQIIK